MQEKYFYSLVDFFSIIFPLIFSFLPLHDPFYKKWKSILPALIIPGLLFLMWDAWFTSMGVWGFNGRYVSGFYIYNLPIEEVLFFVCIPYACIFSYEAVKYFLKKDVFFRYRKAISISICAMSILLALLNYEKAYTALTFFSLSIFIALLEWKWKAAFLSRSYIAYLFILIPFLLVNGILTGTGLEEPIVWYNNAENLNIRMGTIPVEDTFYGMLLILMNISLFELLEKEKAPRKVS
jgi:lycopene cyclase domain-containing protein